jgi:hypothetical protein
MKAIFYKKIAYFLFIMSHFSLYAPYSQMLLRHGASEYQLNISRNQFGLNPWQTICIYDAIAQRVICRPKDFSNIYTQDVHIFHDVYVKKLTSDPVGIGRLGSYPNPGLNPGHPSEYTSTNSIFPFVVYTSKY